MAPKTEFIGRFSFKLMETGAGKNDKLLFFYIYKKGHLVQLQPTIYSSMSKIVLYGLVNKEAE